MKILLISECTPRERILVYEVLKNFKDVTLIVPSSKSGSPNGTKTSKGKSSFSHRFFKKIHKTRLNKAIKGFDLNEFPHKRIPVAFSDLQTKECIAQLSALQPDLILTCRAPLLTNELLSIPKIGSINIHYGIPPEYRGNDTLFWAFLNKDFDHVGASVHSINSGVDRGEIFALGYPSLEPKDGELSIDIKTSLVISKAVIEILKKIEQTNALPLGLKQTSLGKNYKKTDRSLSADLKYVFKKNLGLLRPKPREETIEYYL
ncbi:MAG: formyl transferase [Mongoliitalea sp.]